MVTLITGSSGFIAGSLVKDIQSGGEEVIKFDIKDGWSDITDFDKVHKVFNEYHPDEVYHLAAQAFVAPGEKDPYRDLLINGYGTLNILRCAKEFNSKVLYTSSGAVYGTTTSFPHKEDALIRPMANYGCSKYLGELYVQKWADVDGVDARITRFSSVYGAGRGREGPVNSFLEKALAGETLTVFGDGSQTRDLIYISDAINGMKIAMKNGKAGEVYNIGLGEEHSVLEVAELVKELTGAKIEMVPKALSKFDLKRSYYDISKAKSIGYRPQVPLYTGINLTYNEMIRKV